MPQLDLKRIQEGISRKDQIRVRSYAMLDQTEEVIKEILHNILAHYEKEQLMDALYTVLKELAINAVKANMKRVVFHNHGLDVDNPAHASKGQSIFKKRLQAGNLEDFARESMKLGYLVLIDFILEEDCFIVEIRNNAVISSEEDVRLRNRLAKSMTYENIVQFYMDFPDDTEGAGLGMTMVTVMLRQNDIDPHCFTIYTDGSHTIARLEAPMTDSYVPRRKRFEQAHARSN